MLGGSDNLKCFSHLGESKNAACGILYFAPIDPDHGNREGLNFFLDRNRRSGIEGFVFMKRHSLPTSQSKLHSCKKRLPVFLIPILPFVMFQRADQKDSR